jgi:DNA-binding IclR family transcriptional regulator
MNRDIREVVRDEPLMRRTLLGLLCDQARTVPELAAATGHPEAEVMVWLMSMRKYGYVTEQKAAAGDTGYRYQAVRQP